MSLRIARAVARRLAQDWGWRKPGGYFWKQKYPNPHPDCQGWSRDMLTSNLEIDRQPYTLHVELVSAEGARPSYGWIVWGPGTTSPLASGYRPTSEQAQASAIRAYERLVAAT